MAEILRLRNGFSTALLSKDQKSEEAASGLACFKTELCVDMNRARQAQGGKRMHYSAYKEGHQDKECTVSCSILK